MKDRVQHFDDREKDREISVAAYVIPKKFTKTIKSFCKQVIIYICNRYIKRLDLHDFIPVQCHDDTTQTIFLITIQVCLSVLHKFCVV